MNHTFINTYVPFHALPTVNSIAVNVEGHVILFIKIIVGLQCCVLGVGQSDSVLYTHMSIYTNMSFFKILILYRLLQDAE